MIPAVNLFFKLLFHIDSKGISFVLFCVTFAYNARMFSNVAYRFQTLGLWKVLEESGLMSSLE